MKCKCDYRTHDGSFPLLTAHFKDCPHFDAEIHGLVVGLVRALEEIMDDVDGLPPKGWEQYTRAKLAIGEPIGDGESL